MAKHFLDPGKVAAANKRRADFLGVSEAAAARAKAAVGNANAANSVPALRAVVAQMATDIALLIDGVR